MKTRRVVSGLVLLASVCVAVACGGDDSTGTGDTGTAGEAGSFGTGGTGGGDTGGTGGGGTGGDTGGTGGSAAGTGGAAGTSGGTDAGGTGGSAAGTGGAAGTSGGTDAGGAGGSTGAAGGVGGAAGTSGGTDAGGAGGSTGAAGGTTGGTGGVEPGEVFFDDFSYDSPSDPALDELNWSVRTGSGGPAMAGSSWLAENVEFVSDAGGKVLRLNAETNGTPEGTSQSELVTPLKFHEGTYAARVRFTDEPVAGSPDGDGIVQAFFTMTSWRLSDQPEYGELDFEYLSNGGWGVDGATLWTTTWEQAEPRDNVHDSFNSSYAGWHVLVITVTNGEVKYRVDGQLLSTHGGEYYPEGPMVIDLQIWFMSGALAAGNEVRTYELDVDWVYHGKNVAMTTAEVEQAVAGIRASGAERVDTVVAD